MMLFSLRVIVECMGYVTSIFLESMILIAYFLFKFVFYELIYQIMFLLTKFIIIIIIKKRLTIKIMQG
jgi:hypothetical protein